MNTESDKPVLDESNVEQANPAAETIDMSNANASQTPVVNELQQKLAASEKQYLMAKADLDNYRKRAIRDHQEQLKYASLKLMSDILEISDNLDRAIQSAENETGAAELLEGVKMVSQQINTVLDSHGCKKIDAVGEPFDPNQHEAVQMQPSSEFDSNTVMMEIRPGYRLHQRVVRPSQVFVSTGHPED